MSAAARSAGRCPHCGGALRDAVSPQPPREPADTRYDLVELAQRARQESVYDESTKVRVTQGDIRRLLEKRRKAPG